VDVKIHLAIDVLSGMTSRGPEGYKQTILFFAEGFPDSSVGKKTLNGKQNLTERVAQV
jgi:hypothetical protein